MKRLLALVVLAVSADAFADNGIRTGNSTPFRLVRDFECQSDGGLLCFRDAGTVIGALRCNAATAAEPGCITPSDQSFSGNKTFTGTVKAPLFDGGIASIGSLDLRESTLKNRATGASFSIQSDTADSTTSSSVAAMTFKLGANITSTDLGWRWEDSGGTKQLACTEAGNVYFRALVTDTGAGGVPGESFTATIGSGGSSSGSTHAGAGGDVTWAAGAGGASTGAADAGIGGTVTISAGAGGAASSSGFAGNGGALTLTAGAGGADNGPFVGGIGGPVSIAAGAAGGGRLGGSITMTTGAGGAANADHASDLGGDFTLTCGKGGAGASGGGSNPGGAVAITSGAGGDGTSGGTDGAEGGDITITSGAGGTPFGGGAGARGGNISIDTGARSGSATPATIALGTSNSGTVTIGRSGQQTVVNGYGVLTSHGTTVLAIEVGQVTLSGGGTATATFATAFGAAPNCVAVSTTAANAVRVHTPTTTNVQFVGTASEVLNWHCVGTR